MIGKASASRTPAAKDNVVDSVPLPSTPAYGPAQNSVRDLTETHLRPKSCAVDYQTNDLPHVCNFAGRGNLLNVHTNLDTSGLIGIRSFRDGELDMLNALFAIHPSDDKGRLVLNGHGQILLKLVSSIKHGTWPPHQCISIWSLPSGLSLLSTCKV